MATSIKRIEFKKNYPEYSQGLFIVQEEKRLPRGQDEINVGQRLSEELLTIPREERKANVLSLLSAMVAPYMVVTLSHIDILFTPYLQLDVLGTLVSLCRNRKICIAWPGGIYWNKVHYAEPNEPEYYEGDLNRFQDTYVIDE